MEGNICSEHILKSEEEWYYESPLDSDVTTVDYLLRKMKTHANNGRTACITCANTGETYNYADIEPMTRKIASGFWKRGLRKGDTVLYSSHDGAKLHIFMMGVWRANGIVRSSYPDDIHSEQQERILESEARFIICDEERAAENVAFVNKFDSWPITVIVMGKADGCISVEEFLQDDGKDLPDRQVGKDDIALILPTSGTTGKSKGAVYDHKTLIRVFTVYEKLPFTDKPEEAFLSTSKTTHFTGGVAPFAFFAAGRRFIMMPKVSLVNTLETIAKYKVYGIMTFPKNLTNLANDPIAKNYDISSLNFVNTTGQTVDSSVVSTVKKIPSVRNFFVFLGMTEVGLLAATIDFTALKNGIYKDLGEFPAFTVGKLPPGNKLMVYDSENDKSLGVGQRGELVFYCSYMCSGYLHKPKETASTFKDGWIYTGDVGYYDEKGQIFLVDREKEVFKSFANHVFPTELENILLSQPDVSEACVVGIPDPDFGDFMPRGFIVLKKPSSATVEDIKQFFNGQVAPYKQLRGGLYILDHMPVGKTGKVVRRYVAELSV